ncbi:MAG: cardiolipin synthase [Bacillota bacterium]|nr:cardiolipin synthase [Bacillota bacterium]
MGDIFTNSIWPIIVVLIYTLTLLVSIAVIFVERQSPGATLAWLLILWMLPVVGLFLYLIWSQPFVRRNMKDLSSKESLNTDARLTKQIESIREGTFEYVNTQASDLRQLVKFNQTYAGAVLTQDNNIEIFTHGMQNFENMFNDIDAARKYINIEYFIIKPDEVGLALIKALTKKAERGVKVRLLMDAMGSSMMKSTDVQALIDAGGEVKRFLPGKISKIGLNFNYRNHRKLVVIDGSVAYLGGLNAAKEYVGISKKFKGWRDTNIRLEGSGVIDVDDRFLMDWNYASGDELKVDLDEYDNHFPKGDMAVQIVSSGPESSESEIKLAYLKMIDSATRNLFIQTPYFVPDESIFEAIKTAALSGVDVRIMIPNRPDHPFVYWVTYSNVGKLLEYGVKVYIYNKGFLHAKTMTVDSKVSSVGSANFDIRSFDLNFESNAIVYDREFALNMEQDFQDDISECTKLTKEIFEGRSIWIKIKESIGRLLTAIL